MASGVKSLADALRLETVPSLSPSSPLSDIFAEEPVDLSTFVQDKKFLRNPPLSVVQFEAIRHIEQIFLPETYTQMSQEFGSYWNPVRWINFAYLEWGKGGGKDHTCRISSSRIVYLLMCLKSPQDYFNMPAQDEIQTLNVALASGQAYRAFFRPLRTLIENSPWFKDRFQPTDHSIRFEKQIEAVSGHSEADTLEGLNLILGIADEIGAFRTKEEAERYVRSQGRDPSRTAESILELLRSSARTRFPKTFKNVAISYPRFKGDAIQQLIKEGEEDIKLMGEKSNVYVSGPLATWDVRPNTSKDDYEDEYRRDPAKARGLYECKPEMSVNQFFRNKQAVHASFEDRRPPAITFEYYWGTDDSGDKLYDESGAEVKRQPGWQVRFIFDPSFVPMVGAAYALHGDMAIKGDKAGVSMCHVRNWVDGIWEYQYSEYDDKVTTTESRPQIKVDFIAAFEADMTAQPMPREVQIRWYRQLIFQLIARGFNIRRATFDAFESADIRQILATHGIETDRVSMDLTAAPYSTLKDIMYEGRLDGSWDADLVDEILALTRLPNGKINHPPGGKKDKADALCGAVLGALEIGGSEGSEPIRVGYGPDVPETFTVDTTRFLDEAVPYREDFDEDLGVWDSSGFASLEPFE